MLTDVQWGKYSSNAPFKTNPATKRFPLLQPLLWCVPQERSGHVRPLLMDWQSPLPRHVHQNMYMYINLPPLSSPLPPSLLPSLLPSLFPSLFPSSISILDLKGFKLCTLHVLPYRKKQWIGVVKCGTVLSREHSMGG